MGSPVHFIVPICVDSVGLQFAGQVALAHLVEAVGEYLIDGSALGPVGGTKVGGNTADLPQVAGLHIGVITLLEQAEAAAAGADIEIVEEKARFRNRELTMKNIVSPALHLVFQRDFLRGSAVFMIENTGDPGGLNGGGNVNMQRAELIRYQSAERGLVLKLFAVEQNSHMVLLR